jgi:prepilin peptidase CpaA
MAAIMVVAGVSAFTDLKWRKVPNWLTAPALFVGLGLRCLSQDTSDLVSGLAGAGFALVIGLFLYALQYLGGGDIKLQMAMGALVGWPVVISGIVYGWLLGGMMALAVVAWRGDLRPATGHYGRLALLLVWPAIGFLAPDAWSRWVLKNWTTKPPSLSASLPFALAIGAGMLGAYAREVIALP